MCVCVFAREGGGVLQCAVQTKSASDTIPAGLSFTPLFFPLSLFFLSMAPLKWEKAVRS